MDSNCTGMDLRGDIIAFESENYPHNYPNISAQNQQRTLADSINELDKHQTINESIVENPMREQNITCGESGSALPLFLIGLLAGGVAAFGIYKGINRILRKKTVKELSTRYSQNDRNMLELTQKLVDLMKQIS